VNSIEIALLARKIIEGDSRKISYRPDWKDMTGSVHATILLQQVFFRWNGSDHKPFYKFFSPVESHPRYKPGDSWCEELGFTVYELRGALKLIGRRLSKEEVKTLQTSLDGAFFGYFQDQKHLTWHYFNEDYFNRRLVEHYASQIGVDASQIQDNSPDRNFPGGKTPGGELRSGIQLANYDLESNSQITSRIHAKNTTENLLNNDSKDSSIGSPTSNLFINPDLPAEPHTQLAGRQVYYWPLNADTWQTAVVQKVTAQTMVVDFQEPGDNQPKLVRASNVGQFYHQNGGPGLSRICILGPKETIKEDRFGHGESDDAIKLSEHFIEITHLPFPELKTDTGEWWSHIKAMLKEADNNLSLASEAIDMAIDHLKDSYTIESPRSLRKTYRSKLGEIGRVREAEKKMSTTERAAYNAFLQVLDDTRPRERIIRNAINFARKQLAISAIHGFRSWYEVDHAGQEITIEVMAEYWAEYDRTRIPAAAPHQSEPSVPTAPVSDAQKLWNLVSDQLKLCMTRNGWAGCFQAAQAISLTNMNGKQVLRVRVSDENLPVVKIKLKKPVANSIAAVAPGLTIEFIGPEE